MAEPVTVQGLLTPEPVPPSAANSATVDTASAGEGFLLIAASPVGRGPSHAMAHAASRQAADHLQPCPGRCQPANSSARSWSGTRTPVTVLVLGHTHDHAQRFAVGKRRHDANIACVPRG